jgi:hypothetical protein
MKKINYTLYTLIMLFISATAHAAPSANTSSMGITMVVAIVSGLIGLGITYLVWRQNQLKRRQSAPRTVNRGPVKRPIVAYHRKRAFHETMGM